MILNYSQLPFDSYGRPEIPELALQTMSGETIGILNGVSDLKIHIKLSEPSEISFNIPAHSDGHAFELYERVEGYKLIYTKHYGIYVVMSPADESSGIKQFKQVRGYSLEKTLSKKRFFLEEGTFSFWNPAAPENTVLGRVLECAAGWHAGYISPTMIGRYRTFDQYDDCLLSFIYETAPTKYRCVFVFDPYAKTINVYDADEERPVLPIWLDFNNLLKSVNANEMSDELVTAVRPYGADGLDIRAVNPIGTNWMYDLSHFIQNGDINGALAEKWESWQQSIRANQAYYTGLIGLRSSATARMLAAQAALRDLNGEIEDLTNQQSVTIQAMAIETTAAGKAAQQEKLDEICRKMAEKRSAYDAREAEINAIEEELNGDGPNSYRSRIDAVVGTLAIDKYFTPEELGKLSCYFIERDRTESTFVASGLDSGASGSSSSVPSLTLTLSGAKLSEADMRDTSSTRIFLVSGGFFDLSGGADINGDVRRGTIELRADGSYVASLYTGDIRENGKTSPSGLITLSGTAAGLESDIHEVTDQGVTTLEGSALKLMGENSFLYRTENISEYQKYSVQMELYEFTQGALRESATPTYEFTVDSANFLFLHDFAPFRKSLELGCGVYLKIGEGEVIKPILIEMELNFSKKNQFSMIFSNRFKRHDQVNTLRNLIQSGYSAGRSFDANRYMYGKTTSQANQVAKFMNSSLDAAVNTVVGASNQSVIINGAGIQVGGTGKRQLRIVDSMIAMTDDNWQTAKMAIGLFADPDTGEHWGVNADVVAGRLLAGNNLVVECPDPNGGVMQFKADSSGVILNNGRIYLRTDKGAMGMDANHGFFAGTSDLFTATDTGYVMPTCVDTDGSLILDKDGFPEGVNMWIGIDGQIYLRGNIYAESGYFNGIVRAQDFQDKDGKSMLNNGKITSDYLDLMGINVKNAAGDTVMTIDDGGIRFNNAYPPVRYQYSADNVLWHSTMQANDKYRRESFDGGTTWCIGYQFVGKDGVNGSDANVNFNNILSALQRAASTQSSFITADELGAPNIYGGKIYGAEFFGSEFNVLPPNNEEEGSFNIYGYFKSSPYLMLQIRYYNGTSAPYVQFHSPSGAYATWDFSQTSIFSSVYFGASPKMDKTYIIFDNVNVDFSRASSVSGLYLRFS